MNPFVGIRRELHKIPETGFQEFKTQAYLLNYLSSLPQEHIEIKKWETGIFVFVKGTAPVKTVGYRADIDGLPIMEQSGLEFSSEHPGFMHACGHDFHMSIALGLLTDVVTSRIENNMLFLFQPAEEGPGGAKEMLKTDIMKEWWPDEIMGLHIAPEYKVGEIATKPGLLFANTSELHIELRGKGGHAAYPHKTRDMIVAGAHLITQLQSIVSRSVDPLDSGVVTVGKLEAGTVGNIIAETAVLSGTMRTLNPETMIILKSRVEAIVKGIETAFECEASIGFNQPYYQVYNDEALVSEFMDYAASSTSVRVIKCKEAMTGEDFGYFLKEIPGFMFWLGVDSEHGLHHARLNPDEEAIPVAIDLISGYVRK
ncbi:N-acetyldiaminopimelate deacetylase [Jeotgalibacillus proteolyticus]|uniref:N-acetyldiaminopimelate deacetylase n=1 Tax=Jeotgalibacillus proteolyticus TaxID=2082395 RepID=A0A2S5GGP3_9BACL|nr:N-acetyldiaminopimelate deacetylase [Jeotgalibacillus proteolyticus]PPA72212.1 N-acetyldiaminopimelate deacetylase [Jeotgalibacillus proteolyticus]